MPLAILVACAPAVRLVAHAPPRLHAAARAAPPIMQAGGNNGGGNNLGAAGVATAAAAAIEEISRSVRTEGVAAPETVRSFVAMDRAREGIVDADGLPVIYDRAAIQAYWDKQGGALQQRWVEFLGVTVPFITRVASLLIGGGTDALEENASELARDARINLEKLGPTYVKMGQMMSVRPDILPQAALDELAALQDGVKGFETEIARQVVEEELGRPIDDVFEEFSAEPVAAASLAQVYRAVLKETGEVVAVKVQRPEVQSTVSKDLYVLRRAAEVYQGLVGRFAPQQRRTLESCDARPHTSHPLLLPPQVRAAAADRLRRAVQRVVSAAAATLLHPPPPPPPPHSPHPPAPPGRWGSTPSSTSRTRGRTWTRCASSSTRRACATS